MALKDGKRWAELAGERAKLLAKFPQLERFRASCECCSEIIIERHYGGIDAAKAWPRIVEINKEMKSLYE